MIFRMRQVQAHNNCAHVIHILPMCNLGLAHEYLCIMNHASHVH